MDKSNINNILETLLFQPKNGHVGLHELIINKYTIIVDIDNEIINYGDKIRTSDKTTSNFHNDENFVVLECVIRLLRKGYLPEHIILEKDYPLGHKNKGKLDIFVEKTNGNSFMMIECKTYGEEFEKAEKSLNKDGGQLFTYFQQDKSVDIIMLYTSTINEKNIEYKNLIINIEDAYKNTATVADFFSIWNKQTKETGIFEDWVYTYCFSSSALKYHKLKEITPDDSSKIFNQFLEILRHNVVSDKPNAFNKIFTLFLCKIYDEKKNKGTENYLSFQWYYTPFTYEGRSYEKDDNISFQKRLTDLYKNAMKDFLEKDVADFSDKDFDEQYASLETKMKNDLLKEITKLRLKKNNEFAIKEVFDDDSFDDNAKVVKEVVELLQGYRVRYNKKQQYLSDFFEMLLKTALKQESGQFFTPLPVAQFIIKSIPFDKLVDKKLEKGEKDRLLPTIIDYAFGSGHFIIESMHLIQKLIEEKDESNYKEDVRKKLNNWKNDHFDWAYEYVYGIEKDYRLVKVGKVGCYLHGDGLARLVHSDGLANFKKTEEYKGKLKKISGNDFKQDNNQFDVVISNPPYSVEAFKSNSSKYFGNEEFELYKYLTDRSSEIEVLFVERTKQLLSENGYAGIILPVSILSNDNIYEKAREIIFKYFDIVSIVQLGSSTFMATGTNTVILFLKRKSNYYSTNIENLIEQSFNGDKDITVNGIEKPIEKYLYYVWGNIEYKDYITLLKKEPNANIKSSEIFTEYSNKYSNKKENVIDSIIKIEKEKLLYFILTYNKEIVLIKTGDNKDKERKFLGYYFSERRGNEGIHPLHGDSIDECTMMFDEDTFTNPQKASTYIYNAFLNNFDDDIDSKLKDYIFRVKLQNLMTFDSTSFNKIININKSLNKKKTSNIVSKYPFRNLGGLDGICNIEKGKSITKNKVNLNGSIPVIAGGKVSPYNHDKFTHNEPTVTVSASGEAGFVSFHKTAIWASDCSAITSKKDVNIGYIYYYLKYVQNDIYDLRLGAVQKHVYPKDLIKLQIPVPPIDIQNKIASECENIDNEVENAKKCIEENKYKIKHIIETIYKSELKLEKLEKITKDKKIKNGSTPSTSNKIYWKNGKHCFATLIDTKNKYMYDTINKITDEGVKKAGGLLPVNTVLFSSRATIGDITITKVPTATNQGYKNFICDEKLIHYEFLYYILDYEKHNIANLSSGMTYPEVSLSKIAEFKIPLPNIQEQEKIISEISLIENEISKLQDFVDNSKELKDSILKTYLE